MRQRDSGEVCFRSDCWVQGWGLIASGISSEPLAVCSGRLVSLQTVYTQRCDLRVQVILERWRYALKGRGMKVGIRKTDMNCQSLFLTLKLIPLRPEAYGFFFFGHMMTL